MIFITYFNQEKSKIHIEKIKKVLHITHMKNFFMLVESENQCEYFSTNIS